MTVTIAEICNMRFRMAKQGDVGYDVADVDSFLDRVTASYAALVNENRRLSQIVKAQGGGCPFTDDTQLVFPPHVETTGKIVHSSHAVARRLIELKKLLDADALTLVEYEAKRAALVSQL
jgi:DivIVA domain-containing protein